MTMILKCGSGGGGGGGGCGGGGGDADVYSNDCSPFLQTTCLPTCS